ncbi:hypothetical protein Spb1_10770 [Planctopirus ephydatiae]|jgi:hypothetical protein|uniref:Uncharacterized protein n=1 Tax=Planctopirus ephydatiae TaxID=2528019 RepID=A0A518GKP9_9PLAN|nr:hypothetical protein Spb1_10770 [Planctopirus ephydatiae]
MNSLRLETPHRLQSVGRARGIPPIDISGLIDRKELQILTASSHFDSDNRYIRKSLPDSWLRNADLSAYWNNREPILLGAESVVF